MLVNTLHKVKEKYYLSKIKIRVKRSNIQASYIKIQELINANNDILFTCI